MRLTWDGCAAASTSAPGPRSCKSCRATTRRRTRPQARARRWRTTPRSMRRRKCLQVGGVGVVATGGWWRWRGVVVAGGGGGGGVAVRKVGRAWPGWWRWPAGRAPTPCPAKGKGVGPGGGRGGGGGRRPPPLAPPLPPLPPPLPSRPLSSLTRRHGAVERGVHRLLHRRRPRVGRVVGDVHRARVGRHLGLPRLAGQGLDEDGGARQLGRQRHPLPVGPAVGGVQQDRGLAHDPALVAVERDGVEPVVEALVLQGGWGRVGRGGGMGGGGYVGGGGGLGVGVSWVLRAGRARPARGPPSVPRPATTASAATTPPPPHPTHPHYPLRILPGRRRRTASPRCARRPWSPAASRATPAKSRGSGPTP